MKYKMESQLLSKFCQKSIRNDPQVLFSNITNLPWNRPNIWDNDRPISTDWIDRILSLAFLFKKMKFDIHTKYFFATYVRERANRMFTEI